MQTSFDRKLSRLSVLFTLKLIKDELIVTLKDKGLLKIRKRKFAFCEISVLVKLNTVTNCFVLFVQVAKVA